MRCFFNQTGTSEPTVYTQYLYAGGTRVKKITRKSSGDKYITVYIDGIFEHSYKLDSGNTMSEELNELHVMDDQTRIAMLRIGYNDGTPFTKYILSDHLGSSNVILENDGSVYNREEYYPFGETSFGSFGKKRYRYCGKEKDEESGLYYYGARYFQPWSCRFISVDPAALKYNYQSSYTYADDNPICLEDFNGEGTMGPPEGDPISGEASSGETERKEFKGKDIPVGSVDNLKYDTYFNEDGTVNKVVSGGTGKAYLITQVNGKYVENILSLTNKEIFDRANWVFGEGGGAFAERYAMTIENLKKSGVTGYGPKAFASEKQMYQRTMLHGKNAKNLYPGYFDGSYKGYNAKKFALARRDYAKLSTDPKMIASVKAVLGSLTGKLTNENYNNWRGGGDTQYTEEQKNAFKQEISWKAANYGVNKDGTPKIKYIKTVKDHYFEKIDNGNYRRHTFYKITLEDVKF